MPAYIQGNLALDQKQSQKQKQPQRVKIKETTKVVYRNKTIPVQEKMLYLFTVVLCVIVAGVIIWRYAAIYQMNKNILVMQNQIREIQAENSALKQEVEKLQSPERMKDVAKRLGLKPQDEKQVSLVSPPKGKSAANVDKNPKLAYNP
ncbi:cell division protein FtsL [Paenibacillus sp. SYP-B3998]|uniref:Cell division protein FtsL n=1 Tax=Paenibacillus sp. SYP-B3998 TaxID=2678564 RepID=A0A6G3ZV25_9BACL|nr:cell division protein FtsL [Paenibacillus sp. SYP-B3998]NEW05267.1 cell division protein FtsL [Paenibacillus sp. SYP-B3998]